MENYVGIGLVVLAVVAFVWWKKNKDDKPTPPSPNDLP